MITKALLCLALATLARAENWDLQESDVYGEPRFVNGLFNNTSVDIKGALALLLIAILAGLVIINSGKFGASNNNDYGYNRNGYDHHSQHYNQQFYKRSDASLNDVASKMFQLEQAFKKYQVTEAECEMYIACEASQVHRLEENGPLAKIVNEILSTFNRAKSTEKWDDRIDSLVQSFEYGAGAYQAGQADPCQPLRSSCFELHANKSA